VAVADLDGDIPIVPLMVAPDSPTSSGSSQPDEPKLAAKIQAILDQFLALDKSMDQARVEKIAKIKKALADGTYHVSAAEVARKIIDYMREP
jgi:anti-sigma28 factor (negative regulator of flagellin synthesis)